MNRIIEMLRGFFRAREHNDNASMKTRRQETEPDFIDYDGMGNQGRFPTKKM